MSPVTSRRGPPRPRTDDVVRARLGERLAGRWDHTVTTVTAPPGFGKSTAVAQAVRDNRARPRGLDVWVTCEPVDRAASRLLRAVGDALEVSDRIDDVDQLADALRLRSPVHVSLILDDAHLIADGDDESGLALLGDLVRHLPVNGHLVLITRSELPVPLARLRAQGEVLEIGRDELSFTDAEAELVAGDSGRPMGGWPALVRLGAEDRNGALLEDYVWEEVLPELEPAARAALMAIVLAGPTDQALVDAVLGPGPALEQILATVPLLSWHDDGKVRAHDLWELILRRDLEGPDALTMRAAIARVALERREPDRAFDLALAVGADDLIAQAIRRAVQRSPHLGFGVTAVKWRERLPDHLRDTLEGHILKGVSIGSWDSRSREATDALDAALERLRDEGDLDTETAVMSIRLTVAFAGRDHDGVIRSVARARELDELGAISDRSYRLFEVMFNDLAGDLEQAAHLLDEIDLGLEAAPITRTSVERMRTNIYILVGRPHDAAEAGRRLLESGPGFHKLMWASAEWFAGNPVPMLEPGLSRSTERTIEVDEDSFWIYYAIFSAHSAEPMARLDDPTPDSRNSTLIGLANAGLAVAEGDEEQARRDVAEVLDRYPIGVDGRATGEYLRLMPRGYVLHEEVRAYFDEAVLTPWSRRVRDVSRQLLSLRSGRSIATEERPDAPLLFSCFPVPWMIEFACRYVGGPTSGSADVAREWMLFMTDVAGVPVHDRLRTVAAGDDPVAARGAATIVSGLPQAPDHRSSVMLLGSMELRRDGRLVEDADWRRARVRELIAFLLLEGESSRDRVMDALWPEMAADKAANNLRVNLSKARKLFEPDRAANTAPYVVRQLGETLSIVGEPVVETDVARFRVLVARARAADERGDVGAALARSSEAIGLVTGDGELLDGFGAWADAHRDSVEEAVRSVMNRAGELMLATGRADDAAGLARRVLRRDPYREGAFRLLAAARLEVGDRTGARQAIEDCRKMLADLGLPEAEETTMLDGLVAGRPD